MSDEDNWVEVTYKNANTDPNGGPYKVTINDRWGTEVFRVTTKTIKRAGSFERAIQNRLDARFNRMSKEQGI